MAERRQISFVGPDQRIALAAAKRAEAAAGAAAAILADPNVAAVGINLLGPNTIGAVAGALTAINAVAGITAAVTTVAGISGNVTTVANIAANVTTLAGISANITTLAGISGNITTVAGMAANVAAVAGNAANINAVATDLALGAGGSFFLRAPQAAIDAVAAAATAAAIVGAVQPINDKDLKLENRLGLMTTNTTNLGSLAADGTISIAPGVPTITWDYVLTVADIAAGTVTIDWLEISTGLTFTVEERSAGAQIVAPVTVPLVSGYRTLTISPNTGGGTTILRLKVTGSTSASTRSVGTPSVTAKRPMTVPTDPNWATMIGERLLANDGAQISSLSTVTGDSGAAMIDANTFSMGASKDNSGLYGLSKVLHQNFVVLITIASTNLRPQMLDLYPIAIGGTEGAAIPTRQYRFAGRPNQFIVSVPYQVGGAPVIGFRIKGYTYAGGSVNLGLAEALTVSARAFDAAALPALRTVPTAVTKAIADSATATLDAATTAREAAIAKAQLPTVWQNEVTRIIATMLYMRDVAVYWVSPTGSDANVGTALAPKLSSENACQSATATASISGTTMTVTTVPASGTWQKGQTVTGSTILVPTTLGDQLTGTPGGMGTYTVSPTQTAASTTFTGNFTGRAVLHERGKRHVRVGYSGGAYFATKMMVGAYGASSERAWLDSRFPTSGLVWTNSGGLWHTVIPFAQQIVMNGTIHDNSVHFAFYDCRNAALRGSRIAWMVGGADQTANQNAVIAAAAAGTSAFTIGLVGNTAQDPRSIVGNAFNYDVWLKLADGVDPNGLDLRMSQRTGALNPVGGTLRDLVFIGARGKDHIDPVPDADRVFTTIENCVFLDGATHALTGPCHTRGSNYFINAAKTPPAGKTTSSILNRAGGGGLELFTGNDWTEQDVFIRGQQFIANTSSGVYGHPGSNNAFRNGYFERLRFFNCATAMKFDSQPTAAMFTQGVTVDLFESGPGYWPLTGEYIDGGDFAFTPGYCGTSWRFRSGYHITGIKSQANSVGLISAQAQCTIHLGEWGGFYYEARAPIGLAGGVTYEGVVFDALTGNNLLSNAGGVLTDAPVIHLYGLRDGSPVGKKGRIRNQATSGSSPNSWQFDLYLHSATKDAKGNDGPAIPCVLGDLMQSASGTTWPNKLFVDSGQTFGMGDRTREQMRTALLGLGYVEGTLANPYLNVDGVTPSTFYIHPETWVVNRADRIIDVPESLK